MAAAKRKSPSKTRAKAAHVVHEPLLEGVDASLLDIVDHVLAKGIVLTGDLVLGVADIDLVYLRLSAVLCAADRILGPSAKSKKRRGEAPTHGLVFASKMGTLPGMKR